MSATTTTQTLLSLVIEPADWRSPGRPRVILKQERRKNETVWVEAVDLEAPDRATGIMTSSVAANVLQSANASPSSPTHGTLGDVGFMDSETGSFHVLFNALKPMDSGCAFNCRSLITFDDKRSMSHMLYFCVTVLTGHTYVEVIPDVESAIGTTPFTDDMYHRALTVSSATRGRWTEKYAAQIVRMHRGLVKDDIYIVTETYTKKPAAALQPQTLSFPLEFYPENMPEPLRSQVMAEMRAGRGS